MKCGKHICLGVYAINVKCMYTSVYGDIFDCDKLI